MSGKPITLAIPTFGCEGIAYDSAEPGPTGGPMVSGDFVEGFSQDLADAFSRHHRFRAHPVYYRTAIAPQSGNNGSPVIFTEKPDRSLLRHLFDDLGTEFSLTGKLTFSDYEVQIDLEVHQKGRARRVFARQYSVMGSELPTARHLIVGDVMARLDAPDANFMAQLKARSSHSAAAYRAFCIAKRYSDEASVEALEEALQADPHYHEAAVRLAHHRILAGQKDRARLLLEEVVQHNPNDIDALVQLGNLRAEAGELTAARELLERAVAQSQGDGIPSFFLGLLLERLGEVPRALVSYRQAAELQVVDALLFHRMARAYDAADQGHEALLWWERALLLDPDHDEVHLGLARLLMRFGELERAAHHASCALGCAEDPAPAARLTCQLLLRRGAAGEVVSLVEGLPYAAEDAELLSLRAAALIQLGQRDGAVLTLGDVLELDPHGRAGRQALSDLQRLEELLAHPLDACCTEIVGLLETEEPVRALELARPLIRLYPELAEPRFLGARALVQLGDGLEALRWLEEGLELEPLHREGLAELVRQGLDVGREQRVLEVLDRALRYRPDEDFLLCSSALCLMNEGRLETAEARLGQVLAVDPEHQTARWYSKLLEQRRRRDLD